MVISIYGKAAGLFTAVTIVYLFTRYRWHWRERVSE
jgi:hypothetical protein